MNSRQRIASHRHTFHDRLTADATACTFVRFDEEMADQNVHVRFVAIQEASAYPAIRAFLAEHEVTDPSYLYTGPGDLTSQLNPMVGGALPITMILDGDGIVQDTHVGEMSYDELAASVDAARSSS